MIDNTIRYAQGAQTIRAVPMDALGLPRVVTSATYTIVDLRQPEEGSLRTVQASGAATLSTVATTIAAAAGPSQANPRALALTSATGVRVGGVYLLRDTTGAVEQSVTVARLVGTAVELVAGLTRNFANGSAFLGLELEGTFPADVANDEARLQSGGGPFQVTWEYTIGGREYLQPLELWLTRYGVAPWVRPDEPFRFLPGSEGWVGQQVSPAEAIAGATEEFAELMAASGRDPAYLRGHPSSSLYVKKRALVHMLRGSRSEQAQPLAAELAAEALQHANNLVTGRPPIRTAVVDHDADTAPAGGTKTAAGGIFARG